MVIAEIMAKS